MTKFGYWAISIFALDSHGGHFSKWPLFAFGR